MRKILLTFSMMLMALVGFSQIDFSIDPDQPTIDIQRPTFSENANTLSLTPIQFENGAFVLDTNDVTYGSMVRFRATDRIEVRTQTDWSNGFNAGLKVNVFSGSDRWMPDVAILSFFNQNPMGGIMATDYRVIATFDNMVDKLGVTFNYGKGITSELESLGSIVEPVEYFNATANYQVLERVTAFAEAQVIGEDVNYNFGFIALANNNWALDIHGGSMAMGDETSPFFGGGVSFAVR